MASVCVFVSQAAKIKIERPAQKSATSFAVVIDAATYEKCHAEVAAYRSKKTMRKVYKKLGFVQV